MTEQDAPDGEDYEPSPGRRLEAAIHAAMVPKRLTITRLAKLSRVSRGTLYEWFSDQRPPGAVKLEQVARALEMPVGELWAAHAGREQRPATFEEAAVRLIERLDRNDQTTAELVRRIDVLVGWAASAGVARAALEASEPPGKRPPRRRRRTPPPPGS